MSGPAAKLPANRDVPRCQVPEEFNKGMEVGSAELEKKKGATLTADVDKPEEAKDSKEA